MRCFNMRKMSTNEELNIPWIESPAFEHFLEESELDVSTREKVKFFADEGYLLLDLDIPDFEELARRIVTECSRRADYQVRLMDAWEEIPEVKRLAILPEILSLLRSLYRRKPAAMQTLNFGRGTEQRPHADSFHFNSVPAGFVCGVWIALEPIDENNGPIVYYPRSHKLPYLDHSHFGHLGSRQKGHELYPIYEERMGRLLERAGLQPRTFSGPAGRALLWAGNLVHGGAPVRDRKRTRHSQVTHYYFENCLYYQPQRSDPFLGRIEWLHRKDVATGAYLPQIYGGKKAAVRMTPMQRLKHVARRCGLVSLVHKIKSKRQA